MPHDCFNNVHAGRTESGKPEYAGGGRCYVRGARSAPINVTGLLHGDLPRCGFRARFVALCLCGSVAGPISLIVDQHVRVKTVVHVGVAYRVRCCSLYTASTDRG